MSRLPTMWMPIYTMILQLEKLLLQSCISLTKHQLMHTPKGNLQLKLQPMDLNLLLQGQQVTRSLIFIQPCDILEFPSETRATCLETTDQLLPALPSPTQHNLQKTPFGILSLSQGSNCSYIHLIPLERWQNQPC